jgi:hypothetical protein
VNRLVRFIAGDPQEGFSLVVYIFTGPFFFYWGGGVGIQTSNGFGFVVNVRGNSKALLSRRPFSFAQKKIKNKKLSSSLNLIGLT